MNVTDNMFFPPRAFRETMHSKQSVILLPFVLNPTKCCGALFELDSSYLVQHKLQKIFTIVILTIMNVITTISRSGYLIVDYYCNNSCTWTVI